MAAAKPPRKEQRHGTAKDNRKKHTGVQEPDGGGKTA